jgi:archaemetzincin
MKVGFLPVGQVNLALLKNLSEMLAKTFPDTVFSILTKNLPLNEKTYNKTRKQYNSNAILANIKTRADKEKKRYNRILGVVDADIYVPDLNYVFGEAYAPGNAALISFWRLKPEFYKEKPDEKTLAMRALKEATHELGHTLGLQHCYRSACVMHFSNSIFDTDKKQNVFCDECSLQMAIAVNNIG